MTVPRNDRSKQLNEILEALVAWQAIIVAARAEAVRAEAAVRARQAYQAENARLAIVFAQNEINDRAKRDLSKRRLAPAEHCSSVKRFNLDYNDDNDDNNNNNNDDNNNNGPNHRLAI